MNPNDLARHYGRLSPEERFKLILAAGARGDEAEQQRLVDAGGHITLSCPDHTPYTRAFDELVCCTADEQAGKDEEHAARRKAQAPEREVTLRAPVTRRSRHTHRVNRRRHGAGAHTISKGLVHGVNG